MLSILFGTLRNGATRMMVVSAIPIDIIDVVQAIILMFVAAPAIIRAIYRLRKPKLEETTVFVERLGRRKIMTTSTQAIHHERIFDVSPTRKLVMGIVEILDCRS